MHMGAFWSYTVRYSILYLEVHFYIVVGRCLGFVPIFRVSGRSLARCVSLHGQCMHVLYC